MLTTRKLFDVATDERQIREFSRELGCMKNELLSEVGPNRFIRHLVWYLMYSFSTVQLPDGAFYLCHFIIQQNMTSEHVLSHIPQAWALTIGYKVKSRL